MSCLFLRSLFWSHGSEFAVFLLNVNVVHGHISDFSGTFAGTNNSLLVKDEENDEEDD